MLLELVEAFLTKGEPEMELSYSMELDDKECLKNTISINTESHSEFATLKEQLVILKTEITEINLAIYEQVGDGPNSLMNCYWGKITGGAIISTGSDMKANHTAWGRVPLPINERYFDIAEVLAKLGIGM